MPRLKWSRAAIADIDRLRAFLIPKSPEAAQRAIRAIRQGVKVLGKHPEIGRLHEELPADFREWIVEFGNAAYIVLYHYDDREVVMLAIRHGREAGY